MFKYNLKTVPEKNDQGSWFGWNIGLNSQIKNLKLYYDDSVKLANTFSLIGLPTTIFIDKDGDEFARIIGSVDFGDQNFIKWLSNYN